VQTGGEFNYVYHNSDVENGTWLFDVILYDNTLSSVWVMANGDGDGTMGNTRGLALDFHFNQINLTRYNGGGLGDYSTVGVADGINTDYGLFHVKVVGSRSRLTHLQNYYVYLNDTLIIDEQVLIRVDRSTHFWFMGDLNCGIDNITVYEDEEATQTCAFNTTTTGPPPSIPPLIDPMLILAVGGGGAVVLAAVAVFHKLRT
jgi:hypothetical protein